MTATYRKESFLTMYLHYLTAADVTDVKTFIDYAQQTIGTPAPRGKAMAGLHSQLNEFFRSTPAASWGTLARTVEWCRARKRRPATCMGILTQVRWAWSDGMLPELDPQVPVDSNVEYLIGRILESETDTMWRSRLVGACGLVNRKAALLAWQSRRGSSC